MAMTNKTESQSLLIRLIFEYSLLQNIMQSLKITNNEDLINVSGVSSRGSILVEGYILLPIGDTKPDFL